jgi:hypothetical protein
LLAANTLDTLCPPSFFPPSHLSLNPSPTSPLFHTINMSAPAQKFKVADLSLAAFGRREIELAEHEMPGLIATREKYAEEQPLKGARIAGCLHMSMSILLLHSSILFHSSRLLDLPEAPTTEANSLSHSHPDCRPHRDPQGPRCRAHLVFMQHLLHPGPRRRRHCRRWYPRFRLEG